MQALIRGASGGVGRHVGRHALAAGHAVRLPARVSRPLELEVEVHRGALVESDTPRRLSRRTPASSSDPPR